jgi:hypothetical protein
MKRILILLLQLSFIVKTTAQLTGINTTTPGAKLEVVNTGSFQPALLVQHFNGDNLLTAYNQPGVVIGKTTVQGSLTVDGEPGSANLLLRSPSPGSSTYLAFRQTPAPGRQWLVNAFTFPTTNYSISNMVIDHTDAPNLFYFRGDGRVGINDQNGATRLAVGGDLRFNSDLRPYGNPGNAGDVLRHNALLQPEWVSPTRTNFEKSNIWPVNADVFVENNASFSQYTFNTYPFTYNGGNTMAEFSFNTVVKGSCCGTSTGFIEVTCIPSGGGTVTLNNTLNFFFQAEDTRNQSVFGAGHFTLKPGEHPPGNYLLVFKLKWKNGPRIYTGPGYITESSLSDYFFQYKVWEK